MPLLAVTCRYLPFQAMMSRLALEARVKETLEHLVGRNAEASFERLSACLEEADELGDDFLNFHAALIDRAREQARVAPLGCSFAVHLLFAISRAAIIRAPDVGPHVPHACRCANRARHGSLLTHTTGACDLSLYGCMRPHAPQVRAVAQRHEARALLKQIIDGDALRKGLQMAASLSLFDGSDAASASVATDVESIMMAQVCDES